MIVREDVPLQPAHGRPSVVGRASGAKDNVERRIATNTSNHFSICDQAGANGTDGFDGRVLAHVAEKLFPILGFLNQKMLAVLVVGQRAVDVKNDCFSFVHF